MKVEQRRQAMLQLHQSDRQFNAYCGASYIINFTVHVILEQLGNTIR